jgi:Fe-S-cluster containining protein
MFDNPELCKACGGKCCKNLPGFFFPEQLGKNEDEIRSQLLEMFKTGNYSIDAWEGDPRPEFENVDIDSPKWDQRFTRVDIIRPRGKGKPIFHFPWFESVECVFLTENGCSLESDTRPMECQLVEPRKEKCISHNRIGRHGKHEAALLWVPYQNVIKQVIEELNLEV